MLRVSKLSKQHRRTKLRQGDTETKEDTATSESANALGSTLHDSTDDHDNTADDDGRLATITVSEPRPRSD